MPILLFLCIIHLDYLFLDSVTISNAISFLHFTLLYLSLDGLTRIFLLFGMDFFSCFFTLRNQQFFKYFSISSKWCGGPQVHDGSFPIAYTVVIINLVISSCILMYKYISYKNGAYSSCTLAFTSLSTIDVF